MPSLTTASDASRRGQRILAATGASFVALTLAGGLAQWAWPDALWSRVFFSVSIAGLVGFATNWIAIKMLFHPRVRVFGVQGVVPSRRIELARSVGETLEEHLISGDRMHRLLVSSGAVDQAIAKLSTHLPALMHHGAARDVLEREAARTIRETMATVIDEARGSLRDKARSNVTALLTGATAAASFGPMAGMLAAGLTKSGIFDKLVDRVIDGMAEDLRRDGGVEGAARGIVNVLPAQAERVLAEPALRDQLAVLFEGLASDLVNAVDVASLIETELLGRDESELEELIDRVAASELCFIQVAGGGLGMVAGLALVWPWLLLPIGGVFLLMVQIARSAEKRHRNAPRAGQADPLADPVPGKGEAATH